MGLDYPTSLAGVTSGVYQVKTESSSYLIDYNKKLAQRVPGVDANPMRKDGDWFAFVSVVCEVGAAMFIWTADIDENQNTYTNRRTTKVLSIETLMK